MQDKFEIYESKLNNHKRRYVSAPALAREIREAELAQSLLFYELNKALRQSEDKEYKKIFDFLRKKFLY